MKVLISFFTKAEAVSYIRRKRLDNVIISRDIFSGRYEILCAEGINSV